MNAALGTAGVALGLAAAVIGAVTIVVGLVTHRPALVRNSRLYVGLLAVGAVLTFVAMERALITRDFSLAYVARNGSTRTPPLFNFAALWSALEGSIILWSLILTGYVVVVVHHFRRRLTDPLVGWAIATMLVVAAFFFLLMLGPANPFETVKGAIPTDGPGPNPLLQNHILMAFHPPMLYLGYVGFTVPFAFAIAALITGRIGEGWLIETRRWTLFAWGFLTVGIILGAWWSYEVLGWGGYWAWDPVENASFLPWLTGTAYLHSVMVQERRGMLRVWNLSLLCATFSLTILGTFLTRSGVLDSVHAFSESQIGAYILTFFAIVVLGSIALIGWRGDRLRSPGSHRLARVARGCVPREQRPVRRVRVRRAARHRVPVGPGGSERRPHLDRPAVLRPHDDADRHRSALPHGRRARAAVAQGVRRAAAASAALAGVDRHGRGRDRRRLRRARPRARCSRSGSAGFAAGAAIRQIVLATRRQGLHGLVGRANGGMIVHVGVVVIAVALAASSSYSHSAEFVLKPGESASLAGHTITYLGIERATEAQKSIVRARVQIDGGQVYAPALSKFPGGSNTIGTPSVRTGLRGDVYLTLLDVPADDSGAVRLGLLVMPLAVWLWIGGGLMAVGTLLAAWPGRRRRPTDPVSAPVPERHVQTPPPPEEPVGEPVGAGVDG